jgi:quercetin dioxygenase-like cupin family protein
MSSASSPEGGATSWSLDHEIAAVRQEAIQKQGRVTRMLLKSPEVRIVIVGMAKGVTWPEHTASGRVIVRVEQGCITVRTASGETRAGQGVMLGLEPREPHDVVAIDDAVFVLMVAG